MSFYEEVLKYRDFDFKKFHSEVTKEDIEKILSKDKIDKFEFLALLSPAAESFLEQMAEKVQKLSLQHFGKTIILFTPMYLSNYCVNKCAYCSFNTNNSIQRKTLSLEDIEKEAKAIAKTGLRNILILTGESIKEAPISYIVDATKILEKYFDCVSIEIYPVDEDKYRQVVKAGVDGLTVYQETYNEKIYDKVHLAGPKKNYKYRLDTPERGCKAGMRKVSIGALLGLDVWRREAFFTAIHADYLQNKYSDVEIGVSFPRIRPHVGAFNDVTEVNDKNLVQILLATKIFLPYVGVTLSTRESAEFRNNLMQLGITKMSAGSSTEVGGRATKTKGDSQFEVSDKRNVEEVRKAIYDRGYHPIFKDWMDI